METLAVTIPTELKQRLDALAAETGRSMDECLSLAVQEFVDNWEIHLNDLHQIDENEVRTVLSPLEETAVLLEPAPLRETKPRNRVGS